MFDNTIILTGNREYSQTRSLPDCGLCEMSRFENSALNMLFRCICKYFNQSNVVINFDRNVGLFNEFDVRYDSKYYHLLKQFCIPQMSQLC